MTGTKMMLEVDGEKFEATQLGDEAWVKAWTAHKAGDVRMRDVRLAEAARHYAKARVMSMVYECESAITGTSPLHS